MDSAFKSAPYSGYTFKELAAFVREGSPNTPAIFKELTRRAKVASGDVSVMTDGERLRIVRAGKL